MLPDHRWSAARVIRLEVDPGRDRDSRRHVEVRRILNFDVVVDAVELPRPTDFPGNVQSAIDRTVISVSGEVFHPSVRGKILHIVRHYRSWRRRRFGWRYEGGDLLARQRTGKD